MSFLIAAPESMVAAATDLASIGSTVTAAHMAATTPTVAVIPAAADEVSSSVAHLFSQAAQEYHSLAGQAAAYQEQFVQQLTSSAGTYASAEAANAALLSVTAGTSTAAAFEDQLLTLIEGALLVGLAVIAAPFIALALLVIGAIIATAVALILAFYGFALVVGGLAVLAQAIGGLL